MKKILFIAGLFLSLGLSAQNYWFNKSITTTLNSADKLILYQSGSSKTFTVATLGGLVNDTSDVVRAEMQVLRTAEIGDTATVLRTEMADAVTADTAWTYSGNYVFLKHINDSVGVGTIAPSEKLEVVGIVKATSADFDNGYYNLLIGASAGEDLTSGGTHNIFQGYQVAKDATSPDYCIGLGAQSLYALTTGASNIGIGYRAGYALTEGQENIFTGYTSGYTTTTGDYNVFMGSQAGTLASASSSSNVFIGYKAGYDADIDNSIFIGHEAGQLVDASGAVAIGYQAAATVSGSVGLTAVGYKAANQVGATDYHTVIGYEALDASQASNGSTVMGYQAGSAATEAYGLSLFGYQSGLSITTGDDNSFFGYGSGDLITTTSGNTGMGVLTLTASTLGDKNTAIGAYSGYASTEGDENTLLGYHSGYSLTTHSGNVMIGHDAGEDATVSNQLFIDNSNDATPLIWGDFSTDLVIINGDLRVIGYAGGTTAWTDESDRKLKKNIQPISNALDKVMKLEGIEFEWKDGRESGQRIGMIAQDVEKVLPEVVFPGETYAMQYAPIVALLTEAVQEQQKQIRLMWVFMAILGGAVVGLFITRHKFLIG